MSERTISVRFDDDETVTVTYDTDRFTAAYSELAARAVAADAARFEPPPDERGRPGSIASIFARWRAEVASALAPRHVDTEAWGATLAEAVVAWDLRDDEGDLVEPTSEGMAKVPTYILAILQRAIESDYFEKKGAAE